MTITFSNLGAMGRLGNQLFQLATTIALATRHNHKYIFPPWEHESRFNLHGCFSHNLKINKTYREPGYQYTQIPININPAEVLDVVGYLQSYKYFEDCSDLILSLLTPKITYPIKWDTASIHCRYGDYAGNPAYNQLDMPYYHQAMDIIKAKKYLIFSDDINKCKQKFTGEQFTFIEEKDPVTALSLMSSCEHNIIANSSYSWWAAYLNKNPMKQIIAPKQWFGPKLASTHNTKDLIPDSWVTI